MPRAEGQVDETEFLREAPLRICGSLELERALWQCLLHIDRFMPADLKGPPSVTSAAHCRLYESTGDKE